MHGQAEIHPLCVSEVNVAGLSICSRPSNQILLTVFHMKETQGFPNAHDVKNCRLSSQFLGRPYEPNLIYVCS